MACKAMKPPEMVKPAVYTEKVGGSKPSSPTIVFNNL